MQLTKDFSVSEMSCKCGCGACNMDPAFMEALQQFRDVLGRPMVITSAYRCKQWNLSIKGAKNSMHMKGKAADIHAASGSDIFQLIAIAVNLGFKGIGVGKNFVHIDSRTDKGGMAWTY